MCVCVFGPYYACPKPWLTFGHSRSIAFSTDDGSKKLPRLRLSRFKSYTHSQNFSPVKITSLQWVAEQHSRSSGLSMFEHNLHD